MGYEEKYKKHFQDDISLGNNMWLVFQRQSYYMGTKQNAMTVTLLDAETETRTHLATYFAGSWISPSKLNLDLFWRYATQYRSRFKHIQNKMLCHVRETGMFEVEWHCFRRRFKLEVIKLTKTIKNTLK